jgi:hypothetical protein
MRKVWIEAALNGGWGRALQPRHQTKGGLRQLP